MRATSVYDRLESAAERRAIRAEEERERQHAAWRAEQAERERRSQEHREKQRAEELAFKRRVAEMHGRSYDDDLTLDNAVTVAVNSTTKGYEKAFGAPMPGDHADHGPFTWARLEGETGRIFFDARGQQIPEPSR